MIHFYTSLFSCLCPWQFLCSSSLGFYVFYFLYAFLSVVLTLSDSHRPACAFFTTSAIPKDWKLLTWCLSCSHCLNHQRKDITVHTAGLRSKLYSCFSDGLPFYHSQYNTLWCQSIQMWFICYVSKQYRLCVRPVYVAHWGFFSILDRFTSTSQVIQHSKKYAVFITLSSYINL